MADVLMVDDDYDLAAILGDVLTDLGHTVRLAPNGMHGVAALQRGLPDVVLLDIEMPVLDGPGMAYQMFLLDSGMENIPIVLISGYVDLAIIARRVGTPYFAPKPCPLDRILRLLDRALAERIPPRPESLGASL